MNIDGWGLRLPRIKGSRRKRFLYDRKSIDFFNTLLRAGFVAGALMGCVFLFAHAPGGIPKDDGFSLRYRWISVPAVSALVVSLVLGSVGYFLQPRLFVSELSGLLDADAIRRFTTVWCVHLGAYLGALIGMGFIVCQVISVRKSRVAASPQTHSGTLM